LRGTVAERNVRSLPTVAQVGGEVCSTAARHPRGEGGLVTSPVTPARVSTPAASGISLSVYMRWE